MSAFSRYLSEKFERSLCLLKSTKKTITESGRDPFAGIEPATKVSLLSPNSLAKFLSIALSAMVINLCWAFEILLIGT